MERFDIDYLKKERTVTNKTRIKNIVDSENSMNKFTDSYIKQYFTKIYFRQHYMLSKIYFGEILSYIGISELVCKAC